jgi:hypothetical protein
LLLRIKRAKIQKNIATFIHKEIFKRRDYRKIESFLQSRAINDLVVSLWAFHKLCGSGKMKNTHSLSWNNLLWEGLSNMPPITQAMILCLTGINL